MIGKIKDLFNTAKYKRKYNTLFNSYEALITGCGNKIVKESLNEKGIQDAIKKIKKDLENLANRVTDLEMKKRTKK